MTDPIERFSTASLLTADVGTRVMRPRLRSVDVHWHDYYELSLVVAGVGEHVVNGAARIIGPGSAFLLSPADVHSIRSVDDTPVSCYNVVIDPTVAERHLASLGARAGLPWQAEQLLDAEPEFRRLQAELEEPRLGSGVVVDALVGCLVVELARRCGLDDPRRLPASGPEESLRSAVQYVDRHFREPLTLADAAARAHLSPNYFSERFRDVTGESFQAYLQDRRLRFARALLTSTGLSVSEVCHAAGFNSLSHFGRAFRRRYGDAPSALKGGRPAGGPAVATSREGHDVTGPTPIH